MNSYSQTIPLSAIKGRGAASRLAHRFQTDSRDPFDDGWPVAGDADPAAPATEVSWENPRSVIARNDSPDVFFEQSINPYRGCEHVMWLENPLPGCREVAFRISL